MFGVDVFNHGQTFQLKGDDRVSWYEGDKVKLLNPCIDGDNPEGEFLVVEHLTSSALSNNILDLNGKDRGSWMVSPTGVQTFDPENTSHVQTHGTSAMYALYVPPNYRVVVTTSTGESYIFNGIARIPCLRMLDGWENGEYVDRIAVFDKNYSASNCEDRNRVKNADDSCGECLRGYIENQQGECVSCASLNQELNDDGSCGNCLNGFIVDEEETSSTHGQCIREGAIDRTFLYVGGVLFAVGIIGSLFMKTKGK